MTIIEAIIVGIVQGLTEFLPVSSSGHLVIVPEFMNTEPPGLAFDVLLHLATALAVVGYFAAEIYKIVLAFLAPGRLTPEDAKAFRRLGLWLGLGTIPAGFAGVLLEDFFASLFDSTLAVGVFLLVTTALLVAADRMALHRGSGPSLDRLGPSNSLIIGLFQAMAIAPGISRSGATIAAGIFLGLDREAAARFSFLLSIPVILGAGILSLGDLRTGFGGQTGVYIAGAVAALLSGLFAVHFMLRFLREHRLRPFAVYTFVLGIVVILLSLA